MLLAHSGVLEALAVKLASHIGTVGRDLYSGRFVGIDLAHSKEIGQASIKSQLSAILQAISAIVQHSKARADQLLSTSALASAFRISDNESTAQERRITGSNASSPFTTRQSAPNATDRLLPSVPNQHCRHPPAPVTNFPPLGRQPQPSRSFSSAIEIIQSQGLEYLEEDESPLIGWLMYVTRTDNEVTSLTAATLLATLYRQGLTKRGREKTLALLVVPMLSRLLDKDLKTSPDLLHCDEFNSLLTPDMFIKEQAPSILAMLAANSLEMQKAAAEAGMIKKLSQLLKESYDTVSLTSSVSMWAPESQLSETDNEDTATRLGPSGLSPNACHIAKLRESVFVALAAISSDKDEYRKAIIENGVVPLIIKTMNPEEHDSPSVTQDKDAASQDVQQSTGNPKAAVLAACAAARALSRSVSTLRTSLMDAGLAAPLFILLKHQDMDFQIHATAVICNLVLQFSPMQEVRT